MCRHKRNFKFMNRFCHTTDYDKNFSWKVKKTKQNKRFYNQYLLRWDQSIISWQYYIGIGKIDLSFHMFNVFDIFEIKNTTHILNSSDHCPIPGSYTVFMHNGSLSFFFEKYTDPIYLWSQAERQIQRQLSFLEINN